MLSLALPDGFISFPPVYNSSLLLKFNSITLCPFTPGSPKGLRAALISVIWAPLSPSSCFLLIKELQPFLSPFSPSPVSSSSSSCFITYSYSHHPFAESLNDELCSQFGVSRAGVQKPPGRVTGRAPSPIFHRQYCKTHPDVMPASLHRTQLWFMLSLWSMVLPKTS